MRPAVAPASTARRASSTATRVPSPVMPATTGTRPSVEATKASMTATCSAWVRKVPSPACPRTTREVTSGKVPSQEPSRLMAAKSISPSGVKGVTGAGLRPRRSGAGTVMAVSLPCDRWRCGVREVVRTFPGTITSLGCIRWAVHRTQVLVVGSTGAAGAGRDRSRRGDLPISMRNATDLDEGRRRARPAPGQGRAAKPRRTSRTAPAGSGAFIMARTSATPATPVPARARASAGLTSPMATTGRLVAATSGG